MAGGGLVGTADVSRIEAPVTMKAYLMCAFAAFGGIFFGYDSGYISGVLGMDYVIHLYTGLPYSDKSNTDLWTIPASKKSLIVSILSVGTFFGALIAGDLADFFGRRYVSICSNKHVFWANANVSAEQPSSSDALCSVSVLSSRPRRTDSNDSWPVV
jgi:hypothetical protein